MHPTAHIYFSAAHSEYVIAPNSYTSDGALFQDDTASAHPLNSSAKSLGKQIKYALAHCKPIGKSESEMEAEWERKPYAPLQVSAARTLDEFYESYYPVAVYCRDKKFWIGAAYSERISLERRSVDRYCTDEALGRVIFELWEEIKVLLSE